MLLKITPIDKTDFIVSRFYCFTIYAKEYRRVRRYVA